MTPVIARRKFFQQTGCLAVTTPFLSLIGCDRGDVDEVISFSGPTMGTSYSVKLADLDGGHDAESLADEIAGILETVNQRMSTYLADSELSRFNAADAAVWTPVSDDTLTVIEQSRRLHEITGGAFDPTVGPIVDLWGFGPGGGREEVPSTQRIAAVAETVGLAKVDIRSDERALRKDSAGVRLDLSGVAKGFAVDLIAEHLNDKGISSYLVEVGGELRASGTGPAGRSWRVGIEEPSLASNDIQHIVDLGREAMATSGNYRIFFEQNGRRYAHIIDPVAGRPVDHDLASVTVVASTTLEADALSTAMLVLGLDKGMALADEQDIAAYFITGADRSFEAIASPAFNRRETT